MKNFFTFWFLLLMLLLLLSVPPVRATGNSCYFTNDGAVGVSVWLLRTNQPSSATYGQYNNFIVVSNPVVVLPGTCTNNLLSSVLPGPYFIAVTASNSVFGQSGGIVCTNWQVSGGGNYTNSLSYVMSLTNGFNILSMPPPILPTNGTTALNPLTQGH